MLGIFLANLDWSLLTGVNGTDEKLDIVNEVLFSSQEVFCPLKQFSVKVDRHPYATAKLACLAKVKAKEFHKNRYSPRFKQLKRECREEIKKAKQRKIEEAIRAGSGNNSWLGKLEQLLDPGGKTDKARGVLPEHLAAGLTRKQQADDYALHITRISWEYVPLA